MVQRYNYILHSNRQAAWIGYYRLLPEIIGYFLYTIVLKFINFRVARKYGNNGTFYGGTKIDTVVTKHFHK